MDDSSRYAILSDEHLQEVHAACEIFEQALENEEPICIEDCIAAACEEIRTPLFRELLAIELERKMPRDRPQQVAEYHARFLDRDDDIEQVFQEISKAPPADDLLKTIGRYRVENVLGTGAFGRVYLAYDEELKRPVAIKVPHATSVSRPEDAKRYLTEARTVANLDHPHIVPVHDVGSTDDCPCYIVSKWVDGSDLAARIKHSRRSYAGAAALVATLAEALHCAHTHGLVHRDVKPGNILLDNHDRPYLVDFGLALRDEDLGHGPRFAGTPLYMSPEQARGEGHRVDGRSDIYSLGAVFYELLVGRRTFSGPTQADLLEQIATQEPKPPRQIDDHVPKELERICLKALAKRAGERFTTALEMAQELRHFLEADRVVGGGWQVTGEDETRLSNIPPASHRSTSSAAESDSQAIKIIPKGLRAFDENDADFFLELLPGPRDREGLPESLRFWKKRIEETEADKTFAVGLIYGPSGCGKSSLVKAGLLPRLSDAVIAVYVEATALETETRLLAGLRKACPALSKNCSLKETLAALRRGQGIVVGKKVVIVLDQFEQWLHAKKAETNTELVHALRQCDGALVQCVVMVRDDFWLAVSRFLRDLEIRLVEGQNSALADLFDLDHARKVLAAFGRAFGKLPENGRDTTKDQKQFLKQAISGLAQEGKVVCVRLALFAQMMKGKTWSPATLKEVGGTEGVGGTFLEETFSAATAPPEHRYHQKAARGVLKALLPESGTDIKGHMRPYAELLEASGYSSRPQDFDDLIRILDSEIRLITPTDPEGAERMKDEGGRMNGDRESGSALDSSFILPPSSFRYYQLTHDYLVPALRDWLTRKQKETRRGRAELLLVDRSAVWNARPENRQLPSLLQWCQIKGLTRKKNWMPPQRKMMGRATRYHAVRGFVTAACLILLGFVGREGYGRLKAQSLRDRLLEASTPEVPGIVKDVAPLRRWLDPLLHKAYAQAENKNDPRKQLHASVALLPADSGQVRYLYDRLLTGQPQEVIVIREALSDHKEDLKERLWALLEDPKNDQDQRFRASCALAAFAPDDPRWEKAIGDVAATLVIQKPFVIAQWTDALKGVGRWLIPPLADFLADEKRGVSERGLIATVYGTYAPDLPDAYARLEKQLDEKSDPDVSVDARIAMGKRQASVGVALLVMGRGEKVWPLFERRPDPTVRSYLIDRAGPGDVDAKVLISRLDEEKQVSARRAILMSLGEFGLDRLGLAERNNFLPPLLQTYGDDPDAGIHGAALWLLRQWLSDAKLKELEEGSSTGKVEGKRRWYTNRQGQAMMVVVGAGEFWMGEGEERHRQRIGRSFAIASKEVTVRQFLEFRRDHEYIKRFAPSDDCPVNMVTWYEAVAYCNWLSEREGIPKEEWCYLANARGKYEAGMKMAANYLQRTGYRLPTEAEWEYACRAGADTGWSFGESDELLGKYGWYMLNAASKSHPVGRLLPNDLGLFDMHGNNFEWCQDAHKAPGKRGDGKAIEDMEDRADIRDENTRVLRSGSFSNPASIERSALRVYSVPANRISDYCIRPARTLSP